MEQHRLERRWIEVEQGVRSLRTALVASAGHGDLTIGICAEFDALADVGHASGHNISAAAVVAAGLALGRWRTSSVGTTVKVLGTTAEEGGGGKILMLERGAFDDIDAAMMVHHCPEEDAALVTPGQVVSPGELESAVAPTDARASVRSLRKRWHR
ncbi:MAG: M20/M25/M40 family metallo-hydrolase [Candidatus Dormibacteria bacterium]